MNEKNNPCPCGLSAAYERCCGRYIDGSGGTPYGPSHIAGQDNRPLTDEEKRLCIAQGKRLAELVQKLTP
jgi:hypothetical protein